MNFIVCTIKLILHYIQIGENWRIIRDMEKFGSILLRQLATVAIILVFIFAGGIFVATKIFEISEEMAVEIEQTKQVRSVQEIEPEELRKLRKQDQIYTRYTKVLQQMIPSKDSLLEVKDKIIAIGKEEGITVDPNLRAEVQGGFDFYVRTRGTLKGVLKFFTNLGSAFIVQLGNMTIQSDDVLNNLSAESQITFVLFTK